MAFSLRGAWLQRSMCASATSPATIVENRKRAPSANVPFECSIVRSVTPQPLFYARSTSVAKGNSSELNPTTMMPNVQATPVRLCFGGRTGDLPSLFLQAPFVPGGD